MTGSWDYLQHYLKYILLIIVRCQILPCLSLFLSLLHTHLDLLHINIITEAKGLILECETRYSLLYLDKPEVSQTNSSVLFTNMSSCLQPKIERDGNSQSNKGLDVVDKKTRRRGRISSSMSLKCKYTVFMKQAMEGQNGPGLSNLDCKDLLYEKCRFSITVNGTPAYGVLAGCVDIK